MTQTEQTIAVLQTIRNVIMFKNALIKFTEGEIKELEREMDAIKQKQENGQELPVNGL